MITRLLRRFWYLSPTEEDTILRLRARYPQYRIIVFRRRDAR